MKSFGFTCLGLTLAALLSGCGGDGGGGSSAPKTVFGVSDGNELVKFQLDTPGTINSLAVITGLQLNEKIITIDFRGATGQLYGLGSSSRLYIINTVTGAATQVGAGTLSTPLLGAATGMDFNDVPDRIRVVGSTEQNMRLNPNDASVSGVDTDLNPAGNVVEIAYRKSTTTAYAIDSGSDKLVRIGGVGGNPSPNSGEITEIGPLGVNVTFQTGFDIADDGKAIMCANTGGSSSSLYSVNLGTGAATFVGQLGGSLDLVSIAIQN